MSEDDWQRFMEAKRLRQSAIQRFKDEAHYRKLEERPRCCATCIHGAIHECVPTCFRGAENFEIDPFGICDRYEED